MDYTKSEIHGLVLLLKSFDYVHVPLVDILVENIDYSDGLKLPGPNGTKSARLFHVLDLFYPDVLFVLNLPQEDLPLYVHLEESSLKKIIVTWRLKIGK